MNRLKSVKTQRDEAELEEVALEKILVIEGKASCVGEAGAGLHENQFQEIAKIAIQIWKNKNYDEYDFETDNPLSWWMTNYTGSKSIGKLAIKIFSITPHSAESPSYGTKIVEYFDIENIVCLNDEIFQDGGSDSDNEEFQDYNDELASKTGQGVFDFALQNWQLI
ncbi:14924_t:CDS:2 [Gigaspora margarita]|uniref:14924_t:CDS:1 n=1 Tax=Gigaspora margarita TaxID=4874 RepID=A0ABM8VX96_GIGMA|nr:14924_t:CDS:2 [Gigaspora margarita]